jgi:hypothetical protein
MKQLDVEYLDLNYLDSVISIDPMISIPSSASQGSQSRCIPTMDPKVRYRRSNQLSGIHLACRHPPRRAMLRAVVGASSTQVDSVIQG